MSRDEVKIMQGQDLRSKKNMSRQAISEYENAWRNVEQGQQSCGRCFIVLSARRLAAET